MFLYPIIDPDLRARYPDTPYCFIFELLENFTTRIPDIKQAMWEAFEQKNLENLRAQLHQLQGASFYCGLLEVQARIDSLRSCLRTNQAIKKNLMQLEAALTRVIEEEKVFQKKYS